jgi:Na+-transporting methylmalonyl-CoA/oxaloacetate decarboxylase gamma subunit
LIDEPDTEEAPTTPGPSGSTTAAPSSSAPPAGFAGIMGVFLAFYFVIILFAIVFGIGGLILSCLAIYDCARRDFPDPNTRAMWCLLIAILRLIGSIVYYFVVHRKNDPPIQQPRIAGAPPPSPMSG